MTWRSDQSPGSDVTLLALYDAVEAAEEFDLAEEARDESFWAEIRVLRGFASDDDADAADESVTDEVIEVADRPRMSQAVGLVEHLLGGRSIADA